MGDVTPDRDRDRERRAPRGLRPPPPTRGWTALVWGNFALLTTVLFFSGVFYQRVADVELKVRAMQNSETLIIQIQDLKEEVNRLRDRLDKVLDQGQHPGPRR